MSYRIISKLVDFLPPEFLHFLFLNSLKLRFFKKKKKFENLKDWFSAFYQVVLGQDQGPRLGSFIKFYGINETIKLLESKLKNER